MPLAPVVEFVSGDLYRLSRVLGHSTLQMSARYGHLRTDDLHDELRSLAQKWSQERQIEGGKLSPQPRKAFNRKFGLGPERLKWAGVAQGPRRLSAALTG